MKIRIKSFNGELPIYLKTNKEYVVTKALSSCHQLLRIDIGGDKWIDILVDGCGYLQGGSWEIVDDNITDSVADIKYHASPNAVVIE